MRLSLVRGAGARPSAARHCGGAQSTAAPPSAPLLPRARAGAQHDVVPHLYGALGLSDTVHDEGAFMWGARCSNGPPGLSLDGTDARTFDSADSGLGHSPCSKKSFSGAGTLDVTGSGLRHSPYSEKSFMKEAKLDSEIGTFELTGSGPGQSTYSTKSFSEAGTLDLNLT